ncbi:uncharacterized protein [Mytilus edulis]|uniref:uncharacterized protein n=1 Tax=Mytilus edulis TaxID=6550 RepID=UPI0039EF521C
MAIKERGQYKVCINSSVDKICQAVYCHEYAHRTHPTVEHPVKESFAFRYDPNMHLMLASQRHKCFIYTMNGQESTEVHTPHGLHELEKTIITIIDDTSRTFSTMSHDAVMAASKTFAHLCNRNGTTTFKLN